jgi:hypothetical protein
VVVPAAIELVDLAIKATTAYERPDLETRLRQTRKRLVDPNVRVLVVGEFKQGKSQLINALVSAPICPVDDDIATSVPTLVRYAESAKVTLVRESDPSRSDAPQSERIDVPIGQLARYVSEAGNPGNSQRLTYAEVGIPRDVLKSGLVLVDTPGVGGLGSAHGAATMGALTGADSVLLVSDASQEYTKPELDFLHAAMQLCPNVACVVTKTDLYPQWRRIVDLDRGHLANAGVYADMLPVSSIVRLHALRTQDKELNNESGFPNLIIFLRDKVLAQADELDQRSASQDVLSVCQQLNTTMQAQLSARTNPEQTEALITQLEKAKAAAQELKSRASRWQITLNDGVADLQSDIDYDLRDRLRQITRESEAMIDEADPAEVWDELAGWVHQQVAGAASANFVWATQRTRYLAEQVAEHFAIAGQVALPDIQMNTTDSMAPKVVGLVQPEEEKFGFGAKGMAGMRGGYMGALMFGMMTSLAGLALINPLSIGAGILMGRKSLKDEKKRLLQRRQSETKMAVRKHIDDVQFQVGKDSRDMLRLMQRTLRDHFTTIAEELQNSINGAVQSAQAALKESETERNSSIQNLEAELERVAGLAQRARALAPAQPVGAGV